MIEGQLQQAALQQATQQQRQAGLMNQIKKQAVEIQQLKEMNEKLQEQLNILLNQLKRKSDGKR